MTINIHIERIIRRPRKNDKIKLILDKDVTGFKYSELLEDIKNSIKNFDDIVEEVENENQESPSRLISGSLEPYKFCKHSKVEGSCPYLPSFKASLSKLREVLG